DGAIMAQSVDDACQSSGLQRTVIGGLDEPYGIALDPLAQDIYWTDEATGKIQRTNVSGVLPFFEDVRTGLSKPRAIVIVPEPSSYVLLAWSIVVVSAACRRSTAAAVD
ncbi:MAG: hypothetical protein KDA51_03585, partial [Planctomycetales bacterium]|nr:hypothetical protein [Planctomycetales bacterium]